MEEPFDLIKCRYASKRCWNLRAIKRNGERHNLCEMHRQKANGNQRRLDKKRKAGLMNNRANRAVGAATGGSGGALISHELHQVVEAEHSRVHHHYDSTYSEYDEAERRLRPRPAIESPNTLANRECHSPTTTSGDVSNDNMHIPFTAPFLVPPPLKTSPSSCATPIVLLPPLSTAIARSASFTPAVAADGWSSHWNDQGR